MDAVAHRNLRPGSPRLQGGEEGPPPSLLQLKKTLAFAFSLLYNVNMRTDVRYRSNRNVVYSCNHHGVWCPKYRRPVLVDGVDARLTEILYQTATELQAEIIELEVMPDQVHLLCEVDPQFGIHRLVKLLKGRSSRVLRREFPRLTRAARRASESRLPTLFLTLACRASGTNSYFVAPVGGAALAVIKQYIEDQKGR